MMLGMQSSQMLRLVLHARVYFTPCILPSDRYCLLYLGYDVSVCVWHSSSQKRLQVVW